MKFSTIAPAVGLTISVIVLALILSRVFRRRSQAEAIEAGTKFDLWQSVQDALFFLTGPFPISIALHIAVLLFLVHAVQERTAPKYIQIHLESVGGGGNGGTPDVKMPEMPDVATPDTAIQGLAIPAPKIIVSQRTTTNYSNEYVRAINRGQYGAGSGGGIGGGIGQGYGHAIGNGFGGFIGEMRKKGLDVVLAIDGTGSMRFVMDEVKAKMQQLVLAIHRLVPAARIGIVLFGGRGEKVEVEPFTLSSQRLGAFLNNIVAQNGSFEWREDTLAGVRAAIDQMQWRPDAKKVIVLVGDTPPWDEDVAPIMNMIGRFHQQDGTFNTVDVTVEEHELFEKVVIGAKTISPLPDFYILTQHAYQQMARVGGGEWRSLTKDAGINQQVLILAFGRKWQQQVAMFGTDIDAGETTGPN